MEKYIAGIIFSVLSPIIYAAELVSMDIVCIDSRTFIDTVKKYGERPVLTAVSVKVTDAGEYFVPLVVFINNQTRSWTIAEKVDNTYCIIGMGEEIKPFYDN